MYNCVLLRYGEIGLKSQRKRPFFEKQYLNSIRDALSKNYISDSTVENLGGRFVLYSNKSNDVVSVLQRVAGIQSMSPAIKFSFSSKEDLLKKIYDLASSLVSGKTFRVRSRRIGDHEFSSVDLEKEAGSILFESSAGVNLHSPEITINLEIRGNDCFLYTESFEGLGGLPAGTSENVLCLFSGGIDSPVAAIQMLKKGCKVDFLFFNTMGDKLLSDVSRIYNYLITQYSFGYTPKLYVVNGAQLVEDLKKNVQDNLRQLAFKILLYKVSEEVANRNGHVALVSGESIGQKSSQTLKSMVFIQKQVSIPMLRPLLSLDKVEIMRTARNLGTLSSSEKIKEYCNLSVGPVSTAPREEEIEKIPPMDFSIESAMKSLQITKGLLNIEDTTEPELLKSTLSNLVVVDIRDSSVSERFPINSNKQISYASALLDSSSFEKGKSYLLVCEFGVRSEDLADTLRKKGIKAAGISVPNYEKYFSKTTSASVS